MNILPDDLMALQPHEFYKLCEGRRHRREYMARMLAYFTATLVAPHVKKGTAPTPEQLAEPFVQQTTKSHEDLVAEKEYYLNLYKELENGT